VDGNQPATMYALRQLYSRIPGGSCAITAEGGAPRLNLGCPRVRNDLCLALADLAQAFLEARNAGRAKDIQQSAIERYGCPAAPSQATVPAGPIDNLPR
jgi:hypothetical protein